MRKYFIDNLRSSIVLLVVFYHIIYIFNSIGVITNVAITGVPQMDVFLYIIYPWFMVCLFLLSGISTRYALSKKTDRQFLKERVKKLLIPSIAGIFIIGWISGCITNQYVDMFGGTGDSIPEFIKYLMYCAFGIGPLWFAHELFLATLILLLLRKIDKKDKIWNLCSKVNFPILLLLVFAIWGSAHILNTPLIEIYRNGIYIFAFLLGYYVFSHDHVIEILDKYKYVLSVITIILGISYTVYLWGENYSTLENLKKLITNAYAWFMILSLIGLAKRFFDKETSFTRYMRKRSFGFYMLHYPLLILSAYLIDINFHVPPLAFYFILMIIETILLPITYEIVSRIPVIKALLLGIYKQK